MVLCCVLERKIDIISMYTILLSMSVFLSLVTQLYDAIFYNACAMQYTMHSS